MNIYKIASRLANIFNDPDDTTDVLFGQSEPSDAGYTPPSSEYVSTEQYKCDWDGKDIESKKLEISKMNDGAKVQFKSNIDHGIATVQLLIDDRAITRTGSPKDMSKMTKEVFDEVLGQ